MGKKARIHVLIDLQNGFSQNNPEQAGGSLYVPNGENAAQKAGELIQHLKETGQEEYVVLSQDFHPANHISYINNHPGIEDYLYKKRGKTPYTAPYIDIVLDRYNNVIALVEKEQNGSKKYLAVERDESNRVIEVLSNPLNAQEIESNKSLITQTIWPQHCQQGTLSAAFDEALGLPEEVLTRAHDDTTSPWFLQKHGKMHYFVSRKGTNAEVDSYGILTENNKQNTTQVKEVFEEIAKKLKEQEVDEVDINCGGLATNFCVEYSVADLNTISREVFAKYGIKANINFIPEISEGIDIAVAGGEWPDLKNSTNRMNANTHSLEDIKADSPEHDDKYLPRERNAIVGAISFLGLLVGIGLVVAGIITANPLLWILGASIGGAGLAGMTAVGTIEGYRINKHEMNQQAKEIAKEREQLKGKGKGQEHEQEQPTIEEQQSIESKKAVEADKPTRVQHETTTAENLAQRQQGRAS